MPLPTTQSEFEACDSSNEPIEVKIIAAASDGLVVVTPEKCERIRALMNRATTQAHENGKKEGVEKVSEIVQEKIEEREMAYSTSNKGSTASKTLRGGINALSALKTSLRDLLK